MYTQPGKLLIAATIMFVLGLMSCAVTAGPASQSTADVGQETQISTTYALSPCLRADDLEVSVHDGKATLTGKVSDDVKKELARQIAMAVDGVKDVDDQIEVHAGYVPSEQKSARGFGQMIYDASVTLAVKSKLMWSKYASGLATDVDARSGKVILKGTVDSATARKLAGKLAMNTRGVVSVDNQLVAKPGGSGADDTGGGQMRNTGQATGDGWITAKVKSTFVYSSNVSGSDISVTNRDGIVTLTGKVGSGAERALSIDLFQNERDVKSAESDKLTF